ncbi:hypothetical protein BGZ47_011421 [Haplosporangium gracile]|nr:hypothetical protein BGZ47_011421 [Haplosporangium gracile]
MHPHIATILATVAACISLGPSHASPLLPLPFSVPTTNRNYNRNKSHSTQPSPLSTDNNQTYTPPYPNPGILAPLPSWFKWPPLDALAVTPRYKPIYTTDELVDFVVDVPKNSLQTVVTLHFGGAGSTPFEASVRPGTNVLSVPKDSIGVSSTDVSAVLGSVKANATFAIYQEPILGTSHTVRVDHLHGSLVPQQPGSPLTSASPPLFSFGMYAGFSNFGEVDPVRAMKELKEMGINHVNFVPPYGDGKKIRACIEAAHDVGVSIQYDMRHTYGNTTIITAEVNSFKAYDSLATWYTADEPDGQGSTSEPMTSIQAYRTIQSLDPHRPVMLVLNYMRNSAAQFARAADILMTDVYPVGLNPLSCNYSPEGGCCGCNGCFGDLGTDIRRRMQSYRSQLAEIGKPRMPIWMVLQAFSDPHTCWSRAPTPEEYRLMAYLSLIYGAKGLMGWIYPQGLTSELKASIPELSAELVPLASRFILGGEQILEHTDTKRQLAVGAWVMDGTRMYIVANTGDKAVTLTDGEVATIFGKDAALAEGHRALKSLAVFILTTA